MIYFTYDDYDPFKTNPANNSFRCCLNILAIEWTAKCWEFFWISYYDRVDNKSLFGVYCMKLACEGWYEFSVFGLP